MGRRHVLADLIDGTRSTLTHPNNDNVTSTVLALTNYPVTLWAVDAFGTPTDNLGPQASGVFVQARDGSPVAQFALTRISLGLFSATIAFANTTVPSDVGIFARGSNFPKYDISILPRTFCLLRVGTAVMLLTAVGVS